MKPNYIDIHSHIQGREYDADREEVLARMKGEGVGSIVVGVDKKTSADAIALAERHDNLWVCIGIHPNDNLEEEFDEGWFAKNARHEKVVAIGECGLDYFRNPRMPAPRGQTSPRPKTDSSRSDLSPQAHDEVARQEERFKKQIDLAVESNLPLMLHVRDARPNDRSVGRAHDDALRILGEYADGKDMRRPRGQTSPRPDGLPPVRPRGRLFGNVHFFTASAEVAQKYFALGFSVSVPGVVTFADEVVEAVRDIPLEHMHAETDSPFAAPVPHRGKRNEPTYVKEVVRKIAEIKNKDEEEVREQLLANAKQMFGLQV